MKENERLAQVNDRIKRGGITQAEISRRLEVPQSTVSKVLSGSMPGRRGNARKVAVALGVIDGSLDVSIDDVLVGLKPAA
ncbi:MAG: helix-turn-helix domain-containing protein [Azonexus sp.]